MTLCLPFLMFQGRAQEALDLYMETFPDAELLEIQHHPEGTEIFDPAADDVEAESSARLVATAQIKLGGQVLMLQDSLIKHEFSFTPSVSIAVVVDTSSEFNSIVEKLAESGEYLMEPGHYEFAKNFAWLNDRFGVSWQVNHPRSAPDENIAQAKAPDWS